MYELAFLEHLVFVLFPSSCQRMSVLACITPVEGLGVLDLINTTNGTDGEAKLSTTYDTTFYVMQEPRKRSKRCLTYATPLPSPLTIEFTRPAYTPLLPFTTYATCARMPNDLQDFSE